MDFLRPRALVAALLATTSLGVPFGAAQEAPPVASDGPQTLDQLVDFILRPTEDANADPDADIWTWDNEPGPTALETPVGPPVAGPTGQEPIGPPLAGPAPEPLQVGRVRPRRVTEDEPFAPTGINLGPFVIRPAIEVGGTFTDNGGGSAHKVPAVGVILAPEINVVSENERYRFEANARAETIHYDHEEFDEQMAEARARLRYALSSVTTLETEAGYVRFLEGFSDPDTPAAAASRPGVNVFDASLGVERALGVMSAKVTAFANHEFHEEVDLIGGGVADRSELNNSEVGGRFRLGYATSATLRPFGEVAVGSRIFDNHRDDSGFARSSVWGELRGGIVIARGEKLSGEASIGYRHEDIEDERLDDFDIFLANAAILWSPRRLTDVRIDLTTETQPTSTPGVSASIVYAGTLSLAHSFTPRVRGEAGVGLSYERHVGDDWRDVTFTGFAGLSYAFNRVASIEGRYEYQRTDRNEPNGDYDVHTVGVRLRFQK